MRKFSNIISLAACFVLLWGCDEYDDGELRQNIDAIEQELTETEKRVERLNEEMNSLSALINSSFISYLKQDDEGNYVISYRDHGGETKTVTLATQDDVVTAPIVGAGEFTDGKLYWRTTADNGKTYQWLLDKEGKMMPVGGVPPAMDIDAEGFWIVDGQRLTDKEGNPILANDVSNTLFQKVETDEESGMVRFTLADGSTFEIPVFEALSIRFDAAPVTAVPDRSIPVEIEYTVAGSEAETAYVDYLTVKIDKYTRTISVKLDENAEEGNVVVIASAGGNTVLKPLFFTYGTAQIDPPTWDPQFGTGAEVALEGEFTEFDIRVSANIDYEVTIAEECQSWLKPAPKTRAETVTTTHSFVADYYENDSGADRKGSITFSNRPYGITVTLGVRQSPVVPDTPTEPGIATGADLVAFAKAVNAGGSTDRWENASGEVVLLNDIDLTELTEWTPIGQGKATGSPSYNTLTNPFTGVFDGQGFTIKGERDDPSPRPVRSDKGRYDQKPQTGRRRGSNYPRGYESERRIGRCTGGLRRRIDDRQRHQQCLGDPHGRQSRRHADDARRYRRMHQVHDHRRRNERRRRHQQRRCEDRSHHQHSQRGYGYEHRRHLRLHARCGNQAQLLH